MEDEKDVDVQPNADAVQPEAGNVPAPPAVDLNKIQQQLTSLEKEVKDDKEVIRNLSTENATLKATFSDLQHNQTNATIPDIGIPDAEVERIAQLVKDDPEKGAKELIKANQQAIRRQFTAQQQTAQKETGRQQAVVDFVEEIYKKKPHLRQYDKVLGEMAAEKAGKTGKVFQSIIEAVSEFEETQLSDDNENTDNDATPDNKADKKSSPIPAGAQGEVSVPEPPPSTSKKEPAEESMADIVRERNQVRARTVFRQTKA